MKNLCKNLWNAVLLITLFIPINFCMPTIKQKIPKFKHDDGQGNVLWISFEKGVCNGYGISG